MLHEMMKLCCSENGNPNFEKLQQLMERCAKQKLGEKESEKTKECCAQSGTTGGDKQKE